MTLFACGAGKKLEYFSAIVCAELTGENVSNARKKALRQRPTRYCFLINVLLAFFTLSHGRVSMSTAKQ